MSPTECNHSDNLPKAKTLLDLNGRLQHARQLPFGKMACNGISGGGAVTIRAAPTGSLGL